MLNDLHESLREFLERRPSSGSQTLLAEAIHDWSETGEWQSAVERLSPADRVTALIELGRDAFASDLGNLRSNLLFNTRSVGQYVEQFTRADWLEQHAQFLFVSLLDPLELIDDARRLEMCARAELIGEERLAAAERRGRGVLLLSCHQSHTGFALRHPRFSERCFTIVSRDINDANRGERRSSAAYGSQIEFVPDELRRSAPHARKTEVEGVRCCL